MERSVSMVSKLRHTEQDARYMTVPQMCLMHFDCFICTPRRAVKAHARVRRGRRRSVCLALGSISCSCKPQIIRLRPRSESRHWRPPTPLQAIHLTDSTCLAEFNTVILSLVTDCTSHRLLGRLGLGERRLSFLCEHSYLERAFSSIVCSPANTFIFF